MKLIIVRHGETIENKLGIMQGHLPGNLTEKGMLQAENIGLYLKKEKIDVIFSSDLKRAKDTAKIIGKNLVGVPLKYTKKLREKDLGELTGKYKKDFNWSLKDYFFVVYENKKGEKNKDFLNRCKGFIDFLLNKYNDKTILLVCHNGVGRALISIITGKSYSKKTTSFKNNNLFFFNVKSIDNKNFKLISNKKITLK